ncbi:transposase [Agrobacterium cavarae]|uniref:transposase n=1 Tax=Agrobacterium cavarae TaxID=2528239 RepID=UPI00289BA822|nr:transposase [Agrobacterium cavarae]
MAPQTLQLSVRLSVGPICASFQSNLNPTKGREFAAWLGLTPLQNSSGGHNSISRHPQVGGCVPTSSACRRARSIVRYPKALAKVGGARIGALLQRRRPLIVAVASPHLHSEKIVSFRVGS